MVMVKRAPMSDANRRMRYEKLQIDWSGSTFGDVGDSGDGNAPRLGSMKAI
jgi:hypothetical protein